MSLKQERERERTIFKFQRQQTGKRKRQLGKEPIENELTRRKNSVNQWLMRSPSPSLSTTMLIVRQSASEERTSQIEERIYSLEQKERERKKRERDTVKQSDLLLRISRSLSLSSLLFSDVFCLDLFSCKRTNRAFTRG